MTKTHIFLTKTPILIKNYLSFDIDNKKAKLQASLCVGEGGLEPPNGFPDRFTVCCNCHYATPPTF